MLYISYIQICDLRYILFRSSVRRDKKPAVECLYILEIVQIFSNVVEIPEAVFLKIFPAEIRIRQEPYVIVCLYARHAERVTRQVYPAYTVKDAALQRCEPDHARMRKYLPKLSARISSVHIRSLKIGIMCKRHIQISAVGRYVIFLHQVSVAPDMIYMCVRIDYIVYRPALLLQRFFDLFTIAL